MQDCFVNNDIEKVLISEEELKQRIGELAKQISEDYKGKKLTVVGILRGSVVFLADLIRNITIPMELDFMAVSSYGCGTTSTGNIKIKLDITCDISKKEILIVEDIIDTGNTLCHLVDIFKKRNALSVEVCCLLDKPESRIVEVPVKYTGFSVPDEFVVGYGIDYAERYRNVPCIGILKRSVYE